MQKYNLLIGLILILTGCASSESSRITTEIPAFKNIQAYQTNQMRLTLIRDTARGTGAQAGLFWSARQLNQLMEMQDQTLSKIFNFQAMMLDNNVLPPVLEESTNILNLDSENSIRLSDRMYRIIKPAHFVTAVPSWRDYLILNFSKPEAPDQGLLPKSNQERDIWNRFIIVGWNEGIMQAEDIYSINLNRMKRDYLGMILYRKLLAQNMVTSPFVSKADLGITGGGNNLNVNERVLRITAVSQLQADSDRWNSRIHKPMKTEPDYTPQTVHNQLVPTASMQKSSVTKTTPKKSKTAARKTKKKPIPKPAPKTSTKQPIKQKLICKSTNYPTSL